MSIFKNILKQKKICVTHDGNFHADDLFATAVLSILNNGNIKIIRTRNEEIIKKRDYIYDVGGIYNEELDSFDHHQKGGAGIRSNGIPYASLGLVWKKYGEQICKSKEVAEIIEQKIVLSIDAIDNGVNISKPIFDGIFPCGADQVFLNYKPTWKENNKNINEIFETQVKKVVGFLLREIEVTKSDVEAIGIIIDTYNNSEDKRIIIIENDFPRYLFQNTLSKLSEPLYLVYPSSNSNTWRIEAIRKSPETMECRKLFPISWRGFMDGDKRIKEITGVSDVMFSHRAGFYITVVSKEGALALARKALLA